MRSRRPLGETQEFVSAVVAAVGIGTALLGASTAAKAADAQAAASKKQGKALKAQNAELKKASLEEEEGERQKLFLSRLERKRAVQDTVRSAQVTNAAVRSRTHGLGAGLSSIALRASAQISGNAKEGVGEIEENQAITEEIFKRNFAALDFRRNASDFGSQANKQQLNINNAQAKQNFGSSLMGLGVGIAGQAGNISSIFGPTQTPQTNAFGGFNTTTTSIG